MSVLLDGFIYNALDFLKYLLENGIVSHVENKNNNFIFLKFFCYFLILKFFNNFFLIFINSLYPIEEFVLEIFIISHRCPWYLCNKFNKQIVLETLSKNLGHCFTGSFEIHKARVHVGLDLSNLIFRANHKSKFDFGNSFF